MRLMCTRETRPGELGERQRAESSEPTTQRRAPWQFALACAREYPRLPDFESAVCRPPPKLPINFPFCTQVQSSSFHPHLRRCRHPNSPLCRPLSVWLSVALSFFSLSCTRTPIDRLAGKLSLSLVLGPHLFNHGRWRTPDKGASYAQGPTNQCSTPAARKNFSKSNRVGNLSIFVFFFGLRVRFAISHSQTNPHTPHGAEHLAS